MLKKRKRRAGCAPKFINGLIRIADSKHIAFLTGEAFQNFGLGEVRILKLINQNEPGSSLFLSEQLRISPKQCVSSRNHVAEGAEVICFQHALDGSEYAADFTATAEPFLFRERSRMFGFADTRHRQFAGFHAPQVIGISLRSHKLVMATPHEVEEVIQKLAEVYGTDEIVQPQLSNLAAQVNPNIFVIQDAEFLPIANKKIVAVRVKRLHPHV